MVNTLGFYGLLNVNQSLALCSSCAGMLVSADYNMFLSFDWRSDARLYGAWHRPEWWLSDIVPTHLFFKRSWVVVIKLIVWHMHWVSIWMGSCKTHVLFCWYFSVDLYVSSACGCCRVLAHDLHGLKLVWALWNLLSSFVLCEALFLSELNFHI